MKARPVVDSSAGGSSPFSANITIEDDASVTVAASDGRKFTLSGPHIARDAVRLFRKLDRAARRLERPAGRLCAGHRHRRAPRRQVRRAARRLRRRVSRSRGDPPDPPDPPHSQVLLAHADARRLPLRDASVDAVITSPPYPFAQRDYGIPSQIGHETSLDDYVAHVVEAMREAYRVLKATGTCWLVVSHCYRKGQLVDVPGKIGDALQRDGWIWRQDQPWEKPGATPDGATNRFSLTHERVLHFAKRTRGYAFYLDAVREPHSAVSIQRAAWESLRTTDDGMKSAHREGRLKANTVRLHPRGKNPGSVFEFTPAKFKAAHFAVLPDKLAQFLIEASTRPGDLILDPFAGSGTIGVVAQALGRLAVLVDLNFRYVDEIARARLAAGCDLGPRRKRHGTTARRVQRAAKRTTGEVLPAHRPKGGNLPAFTQAVRAAEGGISERSQRALDRLARESPDLHAAVKAGELSIHAAARQAGIVGRPAAQDRRA